MLRGMNSRAFWPLIAITSLLEALAAAAFAIAVFSSPLPRQVVDDEGGTQTEIFDRVTSLDWSSDRGMLIAAILFASLGVVAYIAAAQSR
jgi:hypothetical protein